MPAFRWKVSANYRLTASMIRADGDSASRSYEPLVVAPWIHREFATVPSDSYLSFATEFGLLGLGTEAERLADQLGHFLPDEAREEVGAAAGRIRHDQADRLVRIGLRKGRLS